ncbi:hypothetical protein FRC14_002501 [Serendipita sp. 396]|nr:hypothetical protein FRC14_002501 [Serendipita sp. 396]KAG8850521.1 hypothetical protein FRB91_009000 [Serendipita sp. 411]
MLNNLLSSLLLALLSSHLLVVKGANHDVDLAGLTFSPDHLENIVAGDTVTFRFVSGDHTATQSTLENPCDHAPGGFDSEHVSPGGTYQITVNDTSPIWIFCETTNHCKEGMVFAINPGSQLAQFQAAATGNAIGSTTSSSAGSTSQAPTSSISSLLGSSSSSSASASASSTPNAGRTTVGDVSASVVGLAAALFGGFLTL